LLVRRDLAFGYGDVLDLGFVQSFERSDSGTLLDDTRSFGLIKQRFGLDKLFGCDLLLCEDREALLGSGLSGGFRAYGRSGCRHLRILLGNEALGCFGVARRYGCRLRHCGRLLGHCLTFSDCGLRDATQARIDLRLRLSKRINGLFCPRHFGSRGSVRGVGCARSLRQLARGCIGLGGGRGVGVKLGLGLGYAGAVNGDYEPGFLCTHLRCSIQSWSRRCTASTCQGRKGSRLTRENASISP